MINIDLRREYCDSCPCFEAETIHETGYENGEEILSDTKIVCSNRKICERIEIYLRKKSEESAHGSYIF